MEREKIEKLIARWRKYSDADAKADAEDSGYDEPLGTYMHGARLGCAAELAQLLSELDAPAAPPEATRDTLDGAEYRRMLLSRHERVVEMLKSSAASAAPACLNVADVARVFVEMTNGLLWKDQGSDGNFSRATERLNALLATAPPTTEEDKNVRS